MASATRAARFLQGMVVGITVLPAAAAVGGGGGGGGGVGVGEGYEIFARCPVTNTLNHKHVVVVLVVVVVVVVGQWWW